MKASNDHFDIFLRKWFLSSLLELVITILSVFIRYLSHLNTFMWLLKNKDNCFKKRNETFFHCSILLFKLKASISFEIKEIYKINLFLNNICLSCFFE